MLRDQEKMTVKMRKGSAPAQFQTANGKARCVFISQKAGEGETGAGGLLYRLREADLAYLVFRVGGVVEEVQKRVKTKTVMHFFVRELPGQVPSFGTDGVVTGLVDLDEQAAAAHSMGHSGGNEDGVALPNLKAVHAGQHAVHILTEKQLFPMLPGDAGAEAAIQVRSNTADYPGVCDDPCFCLAKRNAEAALGLFPVGMALDHKPHIAVAHPGEHTGMTMTKAAVGRTEKCVRIALDQRAQCDVPAAGQPGAAQPVLHGMTKSDVFHGGDQKFLGVHAVALGGQPLPAVQQTAAGVQTLHPVQLQDQRCAGKGLIFVHDCTSFTGRCGGPEIL